MSLSVTSADAVVLGGGTSSGIEEKPQIRYETTDKDGVSKVTAVLSRRIHCLAVHAEAIKQSIAFPGQIVEVAGRSYGAGWVIGSVVPVITGETAIVQVEARREGITPFEWELPPGLSVSNSAGIATINYTPPGGSPIKMLQFDSHTGENRYGWKVEYLEAGKLTYGNGVTHWRTAPIYSCRVFLENRIQFHVDGESSLASLATEEAYVESLVGLGQTGNGWATQGDAESAGDAALIVWISSLKEKIAENTVFDSYDPFRFVSGIRAFDESEASVVVSQRPSRIYDGETGLPISRWFYRLNVPAVRLVADVEAYAAEFRKGLRWEIVVDLEEESATHSHVFYRLRFGGTILLAIDITAATPPEE